MEPGASTFARYGRGAKQIPFTSIPVIDLASFLTGGETDRRRVAAVIDDACRNVGFFYIRNHGVPEAVLERAFSETRRFFALPMEEKRRIDFRHSRTRVRGFIPLGELKADPSAKTDHQEGFDYGVELPPEDPDHRAGNILYGPNQWPAALPSFRIGLYGYFEAILKLGRELFRAFALALDLPEHFFDDKITKPLAQGRAIYYPPAPQDVLEDREHWGIGAHSDYECFTILAQDEVGGLQVRNSAGDWIEAPPIPGCFLINLGDMMARWTNAIYQSTPHRVLNRSNRARYSLVLFYGANYDARIECLPTCQDGDRPPRYPGITQGAWTEKQLADILIYEMPPSEAR